MADLTVGRIVQLTGPIDNKEEMKELGQRILERLNAKPRRGCLECSYLDGEVYKYCDRCMRAIAQQQASDQHHE